MLIDKGINRKYNRDNLNSLLLILYLFSSTLTLPLKELFHNGIFLWVLTALIIVSSLYINNYRVNKAFLNITFIILLIFTINYLLLPYKYETQVIFIEFLKFGLIPLYLATLVKDFESLLKYWYIFGIISMFIWILFLEQINSRELNYMTFGRHVTLSFLIFTIYFYSGNRKIRSFILMVLSLLLLTLFANRSVLMICIISLIYFQVRSLKRARSSSAYIKTLIYVIGIVFLLFNSERIIIALNDILQSYGINSYPLTKAIMFLRSGLSGAASGRDSLYGEALSLISLNNYMPKGIGYYQNVTGVIYPHNVFLDVLITFGFFGLVFLLCLFFIAIFKYIKIKKPSLRIVIVTLFIYTTVLLNLSGTFWSEEVFWLLIGFLITVNYAKVNEEVVYIK